MTQPQSDLEVAKMACQEGANVAQRFFRKTTAENKAAQGHYDPVTQGDRDAESKVCDILNVYRKEDGIFGEEHGRKAGTSAREWVIDPIDGTRAFVSGVPTWGTLVGLMEEGRYLIGAACQPMTGDLFSGNGEAAWLNDVPIATRQVTKLEDLRLSTTALDLLAPGYRRRFEALAKQVAITRYGLDWYAYGLLAAGGLDSVIECDLEPYDIAALVPIIRGAGGIITDLKGGQDIGPTVLAAANASVHAQLLDSFNR